MMSVSQTTYKASNDGMRRLYKKE